MSLEKAKRQRLDKLERRRFEVPLESQSMEFAYDQSLIFQQMLSSNAFSRKPKLSAVVKRSARDKATTYRKNIQSQATVQPAGTSSKRNQQTTTVEFTSSVVKGCKPAAKFAWSVVKY
ncbi:hypothetical protein F511_41058 [Dorcoceras hygrometricum]|uniref:Uncharacterized protein n=1 Tax=Dorcoceras hygrometricum TaxID=472368 RepID=A0A2Z7C6N9_9LAMI|nr:hypothetical protein F511_41058 [Dorcoceras hygrometricum]